MTPTATGSTPTAARTAPSTPLPTQGLPYVALGDSYAAGYGLADPTGEPVPACGQSALDYPHRIAAALHLDLVDRTCAGATTANIVDTRQNGAAPQSDSLSRATRVVTVSIGGNDAGLFASASSCIALSANGPVLAKGGGADCKSTLDADGHDTLEAAIEGQVASGLTRAFATIHAKAPNARVFVVGYPAIFPDAAHTPAAGCYRPVFDAASVLGTFPVDGFPFTTTDVAYLAGVQKALDAETRRATAAAGFTSVSALADSEAHSACAAPSAAYVEGITLTGSAGLTQVSLETGALHPNARGAAFLASLTTPLVRKALAVTPSPSPSAAAAARPSVSGDALLWLIGAAAVVVAAAAVLTFRVRRRRTRDPDAEPVRER
ncbi:SGNH/GDSL hydrolase family protein [Frondihabitans cladoniiphilus]|uniref:SGNH/GDSL hydrolase family protein n=1 Tax=Frondihabitans cladoniiphilus TaxID=715785 RepID=UPI0031E8F639